LLIWVNPEFTGVPTIMKLALFICQICRLEFRVHVLEGDELEEARRRGRTGPITCQNERCQSHNVVKVA
jgi:hypothetical protein